MVESSDCSMWLADRETAVQHWRPSWPPGEPILQHHPYHPLSNSTLQQRCKAKGSQARALAAVRASGSRRKSLPGYETFNDLGCSAGC